jgi:hypothetical protein
VPPLPAERLRGLMTGKIDLVFEHGGRFHVLDYKGNWLGERDDQGQPLHCGPRHYGAAAMAELMAKGEPGPLAAEFDMWRFKEGRFIDESVAAGVAH